MATFTDQLIFWFVKIFLLLLVLLNVRMRTFLKWQIKYTLCISNILNALMLNLYFAELNTILIITHFLSLENCQVVSKSQLHSKEDFDQGGY